MHQSLNYPSEALDEWFASLPRAPSPEDKRHLSYLVEVLFFASMGREEGHLVLPNVLYHPDGINGIDSVHEPVVVRSGHTPRRSWDTLALTPHLSFTVDHLIKISAAANLESTAVVVGRKGENFEIQGIARRIRERDGGNLYVLSAPEPGCIALSRGETEEFYYKRGILVPARHRADLFESIQTDKCLNNAIRSSCRSLMEKLSASPTFSFWGYNEIPRAIYSLVKHMASLKPGGIIAMLPHDTMDAGVSSSASYVIAEEARDFLSRKIEALMQTMRDPFDSSWQRPDGSVDPENLMEMELDAEFQRIARYELDDALESVAQLTTLDKALLLGPDLSVWAAGYPILPPSREPSLPPSTSPAEPSVEFVFREVIADVQGKPELTESDFNLKQHGARHRAAVTFAYKHPGGLAFIASQDGALRCFLRPTQDDEKILLWNLKLSVF